MMGYKELETIESLNDDNPMVWPTYKLATTAH